jgi:hypothetical protein
VRQSGGRGQSGDPPACNGGGWFVQRRIVEAGAAAEQDRQDAGLLRRQLQPARGNHAQPPGVFGHHGGKAGMAQAFFHDGQHIPAGLGEHDPVRLQPGAGEAGGEQIGLSQNPQDGTVQPGQDAGGEQGGGGGVFRVGPGRGGFMQRPQADAAGGQNLIDRLDTQGE